MDPIEPEYFTELSEFAELLREIGVQAESEWSEREVEMAFLNEGFFRFLGYEEVGNTLRSEYSLPNGRKADFVTMGKRDDLREPQTTVYEFKNPGLRLSPHEDQLFGYMEQLSADYGVLTNGLRLYLYENTASTGPKRFHEIDLENATEQDASAPLMTIHYLSIQERNLRPLAQQVAAVVADEMPAELTPDIAFSDAQLDTFAEALSEYLRDEFTKG